MAHTDKDAPYRVTGIWMHRYFIHPEGHAKWTRQRRRRERFAARAAIRNGVEPSPRFPRGYWD